MGVLDLDNYIKDWVLIPLKKITDPQERLLFLYNQKKEFIQNYQGDAATKVEKEFDIIIEKEKLLQKIEKPPKGEKPPKIAIDALYKAFEDISKYKKVMELLVSQNFIYPNSYKWKDKKSGYKNRICAFLKDMEGKNYFHKDVVLNYDLCKTIAKNTFNVDIKSNKTFYESILSPDLKNLIPFSTTID